MAPTALKEASRREQTAEKQKSITNTQLIESFRKGLTVSKKLTVEKIAVALQSWEIGYTREEAEKVAIDLNTVFTGTRGDVQMLVNREGISRMDALVKEAILLRHDTGPVLARRLLFGLAKSELTGEFIDGILLGLPIPEKESIIRLRLPSEKIAIGSRKDVESIWENEGGKFANMKLDFVPKAAEQLDLGMGLDSSEEGEYHRLARALPRIKLNPYGMRNGSISRGAIHGTEVTYGGKQYDLYHAGVSRTNLRAYYIIKDDTIIILEVAPGVGRSH